MSRDSPTSEQPPSRGAGRRLTLLYIFALSTVALLSIGAQGLIQRQLSNGESDSRVINVAGRQRMLSQRLAKSALRLRTHDAAAQDQALEELRATLTLWAKCHRGLQLGSDELRLPGMNSESVAALFASIEPHFVAMRAAAEELTNEGATAASEPLIDETQAHEGAFLTGMDKVVNQYVSEAEQKVTRLRRLEIAILALTLLVLLVEGIVVFRPAVRRIARAVTRLERVSERLRVAKDEAEQANAAKTRFLANVSHELRTPMTAVLGMTELARESQSDAERNAYLDIIDEAGETLLALLNDLIDVARIDSGELELEPTAFDPQAPVRRVGRLMKAAVANTDIELRIEDGPKVPTPVRGDRRRLEQVLLNFVSNAIKATDSGSVTLSCRVIDASAEGSWLCYRVVDTGVGIPVADRARVFEPFTQLSDRRPASAGAGLGLAICRRIADAMGADLAITSNQESGTAISLTGFFPFAASGEPRIEAEPAPTRNDQRLSILVVEDTEVNQLLLCKLLEPACEEPLVASDAAEAIRLAEAHPIDVALIDLQLPDASGIVVAEQLRRVCASEQRPLPKMICVTATPGADSDPVITDAFDGVLTKPIRSRELLTEIDAVLQGPHAPIRESGPRDLSLDDELMAAFLQVADQQLVDLSNAVLEERLSDCRVLAHRLAGQLDYFDSGGLCTDLRRLETACLRRDPSEARHVGAGVLDSLAAFIESQTVANETGA